MNKALRNYLAKIGSKGGKVAARNMTPKQRSARAKKAVTAREAKRATIPNKRVDAVQPLPAKTARDKKREEVFRRLQDRWTHAFNAKLDKHEAYQLSDDELRTWIAGIAAEAQRRKDKGLDGCWSHSLTRTAESFRKQAEGLIEDRRTYLEFLKQEEKP